MDAGVTETLLADVLRQLSDLTKSVNQLTEHRDEAFLLHAQSRTDDQFISQTSKPPLPNSRLIRQIIRQRRLRSQHFDTELFADPAWDILLDLTAARVEHKRVSVTSLCIASGVPPTTALRWIGQMVDMGLLRRVEDDTDRRRAFIELTDLAVTSIARYFSDSGSNHRIFY